MKQTKRNLLTIIKGIIELLKYEPNQSLRALDIQLHTCDKTIKKSVDILEYLGVAKSEKIMRRSRRVTIVNLTPYGQKIKI